MIYAAARDVRRGLLFLSILCGFFALSLTAAAADVASLGVVTSDLAKSPSADAGHSQTAVIGQRVVLDATSSINPAGDALGYVWTLQAPAGSGAILDDPTSPRPSFVVDLLGDYAATLVVGNQKYRSAPAQVAVSTGNVAPVADAGADQHAWVGQSVTLDAGQSFDANGDALAFVWAVREAPTHSRASVADPRGANTSFVPDVPGNYVLELFAHDGNQRGALDLVTLSTVDAPPQVNAGDDRRAFTGQTLPLDAGASFDPERQALTHSWSVLHAPAGSSVAIAGAGGERASLRPDVPGLYVVQLTTSDGRHPDAFDTVVIDVARAAHGGISQTRGGTGLDTDGDGIPDDVDNCAELFNPTQLDTNGDGYGNRCDADLDNDGFITNFGDLGLLRLAFFSSPGAANWNPDADFNEDNVVNFIDLGIMRTFFFGPPGPIAVTFINPAGGSWHDPANWLPPVVPTTVHTVRIDLDPGVVVEYSTGDSEIAGIRTTSPVLLSGGSLSVAGNAQFNADLTIDGATLENANILASVAQPAPTIRAAAATLSTFDAVTLAARLEIEPGATLNVLGGLTLNGGQIDLISDNNFTQLQFSGSNGSSSTLGGIGEIVFGGTTALDNRNRVVVSSTNHDLVIEPDVLIRNGTAGGQVLTTGLNGVTLQGIVRASLPGRSIALNARPLTINGTLEVSNDSLLVATFTDVGGAVGAGATVTVDTGELELRGDFVSSADMTIANGTLDLGNALSDMWMNAGSITLTDGLLQAGGSFDTTAIGAMTGTGQSIIDGAFDNSGQSTDLEALFPGAVSFATGGSIIGGSLVTSPLLLPRNQNFELDGVTLSVDLLLEPNSIMSVRNGLVLDNARVTLDSDNNFTTLRFVGVVDEVVTLGGVGEIAFAGTTQIDNRNRIALLSSGMELVIEPGITVRSTTAAGQISLSASNQSLLMRGTVVSDLTGRLITLSAGSMAIEGTLDVTNDARMQLDFGSTGSIIATTASVTVDTGELEFFGSFENLGTINIVDSLFDIGNNDDDAWLNSGTIVLTNSTLELGGLITLADAGTITGSGNAILNGTLLNTGQSFDVSSVLAGNIELATGGSIVGGSILGSPLNIPALQSFTLDGVILQSDLNVAGGATARIENDLTLNGANVNLLSDNNFTLLSFVDGVGETSRLRGTGDVVFGGTTSIDNRNRLQAGGSSNLTVESGVTIRNGTAGGEVIALSSSVTLTLQGAIVSNLSGRDITLSANSLNFEGSFAISNEAIGQISFGNNPGTISAGAVLTVNTGELELFGDFTNSATISVTNGLIDLGSTLSDEWVNAGTIALSASTAELGGTFTLADAGDITGGDTVLINGTLDNTGQTVDLNADLPGTTQLGQGGTILNGSVVGGSVDLLAFQSFTLDGVTLGADLNLQAGSTMNIDNGVTLNNAAITLISDNNFTSLRVNGGNGDTSLLTGTGEIVFSGSTAINNRNRVFLNGSGHSVVVDSGITLRTDTVGGELRHSAANGPLVMRGTIISNVDGGDVTVVAQPLNVEGAVQVSNNGRALMTFGATGSTVSAASTMTANTGEIQLFGDVTLAGSITLTDALLDIGNAVADDWINSGTIALTNSVAELGGTLTTAGLGSIIGTGATVINGVYDITGQTVDLGASLPGAISLDTGAVLTGGQLATTPLTATGNSTLDGMTLASDLTLQPSASLTVLNGLTLASANLILNSDNNFTTVRFNGSGGTTSTLGGSGEVVFGGSTTVDNRNRIQVNTAGHTLDIAAGITLRTDTGGGEVRHLNNGTINLDGTAISNVPGRTLTLRAVPLNLGGTLTLGAGGKASLFEYAMDAGTVINVALGGTANNDFGSWTGTNDLLDGTLNVSLANGFSPTAGDAFIIGNLASDNGVFDTVNLPALGGGLSFQTVYNPANVTLEVN